MKRTVLAGMAAAMAMPLVAQAADMPVKAPIVRAPPPVISSWTGCYIGGNVGGLVARSRETWDPNPAGFPSSGPDLALSGSGSIHDSGVIGGGQIGCNYQTSAFVWGIEGDINYTGINATRTPALTGVLLAPVSPITETFKSNWLSTVRGRLGIASGPWLFYVTGGLAIADARFSDLVVFPGSGTFNGASSNSTRTGWTVGGGIEWMLGSNWSIKGEYLHADLGRVTYSSANSDPVTFPDSTIIHRHRFTEDIGRIGLNYHFGAAPVVARY